MIELCLQHPCGFVTGPTGGSIEQLRTMPRASKVHFCVPHGARFDAPNFVQLRQSNLILPHHVRQLDNGIRIASHERLAFDLAADLPTEALSSVVEQMLNRRVVSMDSLRETARELCARRRPGSLNFALMLVRRTWGPATDSHPELDVLTALRKRGIPVEPQECLTLRIGRSIRIDMAVPAIRWAIELDIYPEHELREGNADDVRRDRQMHLVDWQIERVTAIDLLDVEGLIDELVELYLARCATLGRL